MNNDLDDTHLCIKCRQTIVGLDNYIQHRKQNCAVPLATSYGETKITTSTTGPKQHHRTDITPAVTYEPFQFSEPEPPSSSCHGGKTSKSLGESYELPYELEADVFFSSLQLQSVQNIPATSGGKTGNAFTRQKSVHLENENAWINTTNETKKPHEATFKTITFEHEPQEVSEVDEEDEMDVDFDDDDDDEDYDPVADGYGSGGKWKAPPVVPMSHTGGKWKPENRPHLRVAHSQLSRISPTSDENMDDLDVTEGQHPPDDHTKGKWVPGTKLQRLEYKEVVELAKCSNSSQEYWCNICSRKLKSKTIYEKHLKSSYHRKRAEPELHLEKASLQELPRESIDKSFSEAEVNPPSPTLTTNIKKSIRRSNSFKCNICKLAMRRHLIGKHLISHYHYRRMNMYRGSSLKMIIDNIHAIVLQSPFQCRPCRFYANTEQAFLSHWNSAMHLDASEGPGLFWCSYCEFECEDNNEMRRHLLGVEHKEVLLAINRSVPIFIAKRIPLDCPECGVRFRLNVQLKRHFLSNHKGQQLTGTISNSYQSRFQCTTCPDILWSQIALQRHEKFKHYLSKYYCSICSLEFNSSRKARRHRKTLDHKKKAAEAISKSLKDGLREYFDKKEENSLTPTKNKIVMDNSSIDEKPCSSKQALQQTSNTETSISSGLDRSLERTSSSLEEDPKVYQEKGHSIDQHSCIVCSRTFKSAQELGRHSRNCQCTTMVSVEELKKTTSFKETTNESGEKVLQCDLCDFKSPFQSDILFHRVFHYYGSVRQNQLLSCPLCEKPFRKHSLRFHLHTHLDEKLYKCNKCNATFSRPYNLKDHIKNIHRNVKKETEHSNIKATRNDDKMFPCDFCKKVFKSKHPLKMHRLTHHPENQSTADAEQPELLKCPQENCEYRTPGKYLLTIHLHSHSMEQFKCPEKDCDYVGKSKLHLRRHLRFHTPPAEAKLFSCEQCSFKTKIKAHIQRHMRQHTGEKPCLCPYCDFRCATWENLRKHILKTDKHAGKYVYECKNCEENLDIESTEDQTIQREIFKTNSYQEYQQHLRNVHQKET